MPVQLQTILHHPIIRPFTHRIKKHSLQKSWTRTALVYHIYVQSFKDTNGDGIGDLQGIIDSLDYLHNNTDKSLGITTLCLSPIFPSPMKDQGYDPSDYYSINPLFGELKTFDRLVAECHWRGIKVVIDFVENHTSEEHPWFLESKSSQFNPKSDWYIWKDPKPDGSAPNNWLSVFGGSAWEYAPERGQYYLHSYFKEQADLNWRNPEVVSAMRDIIKFWISRGVDGFRCDAANHLLKDEEFRDEPLNPNYVQGTTKPWYKYDHPYMRNRPETPLVLGNLADFAAEFGDIFFIAEANLSLSQMKAYYQASKTHRLMPFNFNPFKLPWKAESYKTFVEEYHQSLGKFDLPNYVFGNHDRSRFATNSEEKARVLSLFLLTSKGMPFIYQGDEIGMTNTTLAAESQNDRFEKGSNLNRDTSRTPMQWSKRKNAGFTNGVPWLPVNENYKKVNVEEEFHDPQSILTLYRKLAHLRQTSPSLLKGDYQTIKTDCDDVFAYTRTYKKETYLTLLNFSDKDVVVTPKAKVYAGRFILSTFLDKKGKDVILHSIDLRGNEGVMLLL